MTAEQPRPLTYRWAGHDEWMLVQDGDASDHIILVQPLFGELNRCRRLLRDVMRGLTQRGIGSTLLDLPGTGESPRKLGACDWSDWTGAVAAVAARGDRRTHLASMRGGALLDGDADAVSRWRLSPVSGAAMLRELSRAQAIGDHETEGAAAPNELAGYLLSADLIERLGSTEPATASPLRTVRVEGDAGQADAFLSGPALWRRAEPGHSLLLAEAIADDLTAWIKTCAA